MLLGYAWQHLFFDVPYPILLWDEGLLQPCAQFFGIEWSVWTDTIFSYDHITIFAKCVGLLFIFTAIFILFLRDKININTRLLSIRYFDFLLLLSGCILLFISFLSCKDQYYRPVQFLEYSLQWPLVFVLYMYNTLISRQLVKKILIALIVFTFASHGLYALNLYPIPTSFINMGINILQLDEQTTRTFLKIMGGLDLFFCALLFVPKLQKTALVYCIIWGFLTALARICANINLHDWGYTFGRYGFEFLIRTPHFLIPLCLLMYPEKKNK